MLPALYSSCSIGPGYQPPTIAEQVNNAGSIFAGRVKRVIEVIPDQTWAVILENYQIIKRGELTREGWQPRYLEISGFARPSLCGPAPPRVGDEVIVFVCPNKERDTWLTPRIKRYWGRRYWSLNKFEIGAGMIEKTSQRQVNQLQRLRRTLRPQRERRPFGSCGAERDF
jgi:hypothetical protein